MSSLDARLVNLFGAATLAATDRLQPAIEAALSQRGAAAAALVHVRDYPGESVEQLSRVLSISQPGTVAVVERLAGDGLIERRPGADRRTHALFATEAGQDRAQKLLQARANALEELLAPLTAAEREQLTPLLEKIVAGLATDRPGARTVCRLCARTVCCLASGCPLDHTLNGLA